MKIEFIYLKHYDLIFHVMAYFKVNNASDLYDEDYIAEMTKEKAGFDYDVAPAVGSIQEYYNDNFERLVLINFLPYYCSNYDEMKNSFLMCDRFTEDDLKYFIKPFTEMLDNESVFFFEYWDKLDRISKPSKNLTEYFFEKELEKYRHVFSYFNKPCKVLFSYNIARNGRGFYSDTHFAALVRFPKNEADAALSFIQLLHEYTHSFTDNLLNKNITMSDDTHNLSENLVIVADYFLIKAIDESFIPTYFEWIKNGRGEDLGEEKFLEIFNIGDNLKSDLMSLLSNILSSR